MPLRLLRPALPREAPHPLRLRVIFLPALLALLLLALLFLALLPAMWRLARLFAALPKAPFRTLEPVFAAP